MAIEATSSVGATTGSAAATSTTTTSTTSSKTMGQDAFLTLLVEQLKNQDPTNPMDNSQFITQLAQFSQLEKLSSISTQVSAISQLLVAQTMASTTGGSTGQQCVDISHDLEHPGNHRRLVLTIDLEPTAPAVSGG